MVHIVVVGSINMDLVVSAERIPMPGETVLGHGFNTFPGDSFVGAFAVGLAEGLPMEKVVLRGCAAGALATTRLGAQPSIATKKAVDELIAGWRQT